MRSLIFAIIAFSFGANLFGFEEKAVYADKDFSLARLIEVQQGDETVWFWQDIPSQQILNLNKLMDAKGIVRIPGILPFSIKKDRTGNLVYLKNKNETKRTFEKILYDDQDNSQVFDLEIGDPTTTFAMRNFPESLTRKILSSHRSPDGKMLLLYLEYYLERPTSADFPGSAFDVVLGLQTEAGFLLLPLNADGVKERDDGSPRVFPLNIRVKIGSNSEIAFKAKQATSEMTVTRTGQAEQIWRAVSRQELGSLVLDFRKGKISRNPIPFLPARIASIGGGFTDLGDIFDNCLKNLSQINLSTKLSKRTPKVR